MVRWTSGGKQFPPGGGKVTTLIEWLEEVPPGKIGEALKRPATNSSRDKSRLLKRAAQIENVAKAMGAKIEVLF
jgi:hypothetical protein